MHERYKADNIFRTTKKWLDKALSMNYKGAQWLSGRLLDSETKGPHVPASPASQRYVLEQDKLILA